MLILALDTSTRAGSAAVLRDDEVLALVRGDTGRTHAERLPGELQAALTTAGVRPGDVDLLAVAAGPGAFTGLRIGLAAIQGLALTLGKPVVGVPSLDALASSTNRESGVGPVRRSPGEGGSRESEERLIGCWMDAQRGEVFAALYSASLEPVDPPSVDTPENMLARWRAFTAGGRLDAIAGDGAIRYADLLAAAGLRAVPAPDLAPAVGRLARARAAAAGPPHALAPIYIRRPDAEIDRDRRSPS